MTQKRFVYYEHKGADYILDTPNKSLDFIEMLGDCLEPEEIVDLLNELNEENKELKEENDVLRKQLETEYCSGHLKKSDVKDSHLIIDGNEVNCKIEELRASGYSDEYINKELGHLVNWRI